MPSALSKRNAQGKQQIINYYLHSAASSKSFLPDPKESSKCIFVRENRLSRKQVGELWDSIIDEFENGLYFSVQPDIWGLVLQVAHRLNIQVFATTHSWDCIKVFQEALQEDKQEEGLLIRLQWRKDEVGAVLYDEEDLKIATHEQIEVR